MSRSVGRSYGRVARFVLALGEDDGMVVRSEMVEKSWKIVIVVRFDITRAKRDTVLTPIQRNQASLSLYIAFQRPW